MRSLFAKTFLWFWLAMILVGTVHAIAGFRWGPMPYATRWVAVNRQSLRLYADSVEGILSRNGLDAARDRIEDLAADTEFQGYVFDEDARLLGDAEPPRGVQEAAEQALRDQPIRMKRRGKIVLTARKMTDEQGNAYAFVGTLPHYLAWPIDWKPLGSTIQFAFTMATAMLVCYAFARRVTNPIRRLRAVSRDLAEGRLSARIGAKAARRKDEIGGLARDFDFMADRIGTLLASQRSLLRDISHELRSPLARLNVALELARQRAGDEAAPLLNRIERESDRLNELVGQVLTLTRLESGTAKMQSAPIDLAELVEQVASDASFEAQGADKRVEVEHVDPCRITGSAELLRRAVENVVRNAVRYTPPHTVVTLSLRHDVDARVAVIRVHDHGPGVPEDALDRLFEPFHRVEVARDRQSGGTGLGLAITRRAVEAHGGSATASNAPNGGLIVEIRLPLETSSAPDTPSPPPQT